MICFTTFFATHNNFKKQKNAVMILKRAPISKSLSKRDFIHQNFDASTKNTFNRFSFVETYFSLIISE